MAGLPGGLARHTYDLVWVDGPDAVTFLDGIVSQELKSMPAGSVGRAFFLQPQGKLRHLMWVLRGDERVGLLVDAGRGSMLADDLGYYRIRVKADVRVDPRPIDIAWGVGGLETPGWNETDRGITGLLVGRGISRTALAAGAGEEAPSLTDEAARRWRVSAGEPVMDVDVDESTIPQETGLVGEAVSFTKGCYLGQELVARIDTRGHVNKRLCGLRIPSGSVSDDGTELTSGDQVVGALTSAVPDTSTSHIVALAMIRREVEVGESVTVAGSNHQAVVEALPLVTD